LSALAGRALCLLADRPTLGEMLLPALSAVLGAVERGRVVVIERGESDARRRLAHLARLIPLCRDHDALVLVSRRVDLALTAGADGVHLPERALPPELVRATWPAFVIGRSCHDRAGLLAAAAAGADYALLSPVAPPHSKPAPAPPLGVAGFAAAVAGLALPVFGLGGVTPALAAGLRRAGAAGLATLGGVLGAADPARAATALLAAWDLAAPPAHPSRGE
jgi:thiamine-phosphate pyrophosphorylase